MKNLIGKIVYIGLNNGYITAEVVSARCNSTGALCELLSYAEGNYKDMESGEQLDGLQLCLEMQEENITWGFSLKKLIKGHAKWEREQRKEAKLNAKARRKAEKARKRVAGLADDAVRFGQGDSIPQRRDIRGSGTAATVEESMEIADEPRV